MNNLKSALTCSNCTKIFKHPVELPCKHNVCKEHLIEKNVQKQNKIKCVECKQEYQVKDNEFKSVELFKKLLDDQLYLSDEEISLKQKIEDSIRVFYQLYEEFLLGKTSLDLSCHNHFQELRFQIDEHREELKAKIDKVALEMIDKTKQLEAKYLTSLNAISVETNKTLELEIKETEEAFRNPTILIESIREMQCKQEDAVKMIKIKLDELRQANDHLKASNEFKANLSFSQDSFGSLTLNEYPKSDPFKSLILTGLQPMQLIKLCEFSTEDKWSLLYRGSRDGFEPSDFHLRCDGKSPTLTIYKAKESSFIFGAYTTGVWHQSNTFISDSKAFLFSLTNKDDEPCKMNIDPYQSHHAIFGGTEHGPSFGYGDICFLRNPNTKYNSYSKLGTSYNHPRYTEGSNEIKCFLAGSYKFQLSEIEVYQKNDLF
jgi:hypothetical protein